MGLFVEPNPVPDLQAIRELRTEAEALEATFGENAYSNYLLRHGLRPDAKTAAAIGRLLGAQVEAADGTMQPPLSASDRAVLKSDRKRRKAFAQRRERLFRLKMAIAALAEPIDDQTELVRDALAIAPEIAANLDSAICSLKRFAEGLRVQIKAETKDSNIRRCRDEQGHT